MPTFLTIDGPHFKDEHNRQVTLRGINVAGDSKMPARPDQPSHIPDNFYDGDNVSFVGRPFTLSEADLHFRRLRNYGYNTIRYLFTWEAIEAKGPGIYDEEWIQSTIAILRKAKEYDFMVFMDPHQDVWSRFSGGSGAPMWTLYAMGLNPQAFDTTEAALVHNTYPDTAKFPKMIWSTNYQRMANQVAWTLFFAGRDFAPKAIIDGVNIQDYLQGHFIDAVAHLAKRINEAGDLEDCPIIGWESLNEPNRGLIGYKALDGIPEEQKLQKGTSPTAWQAILTGSGRACEIDTWDFGGTGPYKTGKALVDPKGVKAWLSADYDDSRYGWKRSPEWKLGECIWAQHRVWDPETDTLLKTDYFSKTADGRPLNAAAFTDTYFMDYYRVYSKKIRSIHKNAIMFCQPPVLEIPPVIKGTADAHERFVYAPHYYDGITLMTKKWNRIWNIDVLGVLRGRYLTPALAIKLGETAIRNCLRDQLKAMIQEGIDNIGVTPCVFTEIGIPYDMDDKYAYKTGDFISQIRAMDANHFALEGAQAGFTLWVYTANNNHQWGDNWNGEDLSIYSPDDRDPHSQADDKRINDVDQDNLKRAVSRNTMSTDRSSLQDEVQATRAAEAFVRPSSVYTNGIIIEASFDLAKVTFRLKLVAAKATDESWPTEMFVPPFHFPKGETEVEVSGGKWEYDAERSVLRWWHMEGEQEIKVKGVGRRKIWGEDEGYLEMFARNYGNLGQCSIM
ncbi:glycoside hydrolase superfamily [Sphaerosporella brunnea]|uniref:Glycoside hydrolase superfamily n=1 Tax=Sphaerosporella brunnea TaxID=1250544 RepID=A0A5J5F206_9PEZI|nr:glycoside hydrolase superfamily [Sphaerosporella brunnea]